MTSTVARGREWGDENAHRWHPFASEPRSGSYSLPDDVFTDAFLSVPVPAGSDGTVYVDSIDFGSGELLARCGDAALSGSFGPGSGVVEIMSGGVRRGVLSTGPGFPGAVASGVVYEFEGGVPLDASCVCAVPASGVLSVRFGEGGPLLSGCPVSVEGDGVVSARISRRPDGDFEIAFDAVASGTAHDTGDSEYNRSRQRVLRSLGVSVMGKTPVVIGTYHGHGETEDGGDGSWTYKEVPAVELYTPYLSTENVCYSASRDSAVSEIYDTCQEDWKCERLPRRSYSIGTSLSGCSVWINTPPDLLGVAGKNGILVAPVSGRQTPNAPRLSGLSGKAAAEEMKRIAAAPSESGNGIAISIPGISHV